MFSDETRSWLESKVGTDPAWAADFFLRFYHRPLGRLLDLRAADAIECASGKGLNAIAFVLAGGRSIVGYDKTQAAVDIASELAERVGLPRTRVRFELGDIHALPAGDADVVFTLQTLEHVSRPVEALEKLAGRARRALVLSTPNLWFPKDGHDTGLLFGHWMPTPLRRRYAARFGGRTDQFCRFLSMRQIAAALPKFHRATSAYNFERIDAWLAEFPCYFPYGKEGGRWLPARTDAPRWRAASLAFAAAPRLAGAVAPMNEAIFLRTGA